MEEVWRSVPGWPTYEVSSIGRIRKGERILSVSTHHSGYRVVTLKDGKRIKQFVLHRVVAMGFLPEAPGENYQLNHIDGVKANCFPENLEWLTPKENMRHAYLLGLRHGRKGSKHHAAKISEKDVPAIREMIPRMLAKEIAALYGISVSTVYDIKQGRTWLHV